MKLEFVYVQFYSYRWFVYEIKRLRSSYERINQVEKIQILKQRQKRTRKIQMIGFVQCSPSIIIGILNSECFCSYTWGYTDFDSFFSLRLQFVTSLLFLSLFRTISELTVHSSRCIWTARNSNVRLEPNRQIRVVIFHLIKFITESIYFN